MSPWDFELANMPQSKVDGAKIISIDQPNDLYESCNVFKSSSIRGKPSVIPHSTGRTYANRGPIRQKDIDLILSYLDKHWHNKEN